MTKLTSTYHDHKAQLAPSLPLTATYTCIQQQAHSYILTIHPMSTHKYCTSVSSHSYCSLLLLTVATVCSYQAHATDSYCSWLTAKITIHNLPGPFAKTMFTHRHHVHSQSPWLLLWVVTYGQQLLTVTIDSNKYSQLPGQLTNCPITVIAHWLLLTNMYHWR